MAASRTAASACGVPIALSGKIDQIVAFTQPVRSPRLLGEGAVRELAREDRRDRVHSRRRRRARCPTASATRATRSKSVVSRQLRGVASSGRRRRRRRPACAWSRGLMRGGGERVGGPGAEVRIRDAAATAAEAAVGVLCFLQEADAAVERAPGFRDRRPPNSGSPETGRPARTQAQRAGSGRAHGSSRSQPQRQRRGSGQLPGPRRRA